MRRTITIVDARRQLGRLAEEVRRTGRPVVLTRRGRPVARIAPEPTPSGREARDAFAALRGTVRLETNFEDLQRAVRALRGEFARSLARRSTRRPRRG
jgi:prevent-host-death family protein